MMVLKVHTGDPLPPGFVESSEPSWKSSEGLGPFLEGVQSAFLSLEGGVVLANVLSADKR